MYKAHVFFLIAVLFPAFIFAQTGSIKGAVKDSVGNPIEGATIFIKGTSSGTTSDAKGNFVIDNIAAGSYMVLVNNLGYLTSAQQVVVRANAATVQNFNLVTNTQLLKELTIMGTPSINGMGYMMESKDGIIYSGMKTEVLVMDSMDANTAQDNPREVLGRIPGSNYSETEGGGFPSNGIGLRGLLPTQSIEMQTRQDGYNIAADLYGYPETYYMPPLEALERIEVTRGESSLEWGPQFGGVVNFIIKEAPADKPFEGTVQLTGGSYEFFNAFMSIGGTYKKFKYFFYAQPKYSLGYRPNSDMTQISAFGRVEYKFNPKFKLGLEYSLLRNRIHMAGGLDDAEFDANPYQSVRARNWLKSPWNILALSAEYKATSRIVFTFKSALNTSARDLVWRNEDGGIQTPDTINPATNQFSPREVEHEGFLSTTNELRMLAHYNILGFDQTFAAGIRYFQGYMKRQEGGPGSTGSDFNMNLYGGAYQNDLSFYTINIAPYVENTFHIGSVVSVTPGFRFEYVRSKAQGYITDPNTSEIVNVNLQQYWLIPLGGIGLQFKTTPTTNIYANFSQCYEPTSYANLTPLGSTSVIDPNLKDVSGYNSDLGWRGNIKNIVNFDVGAFFLGFNREIGTETLINSQGNPYTYVTNLGDAIHTGAETYIEVSPFVNSSRYTGWGRISVFNSYSYIDAFYSSGPFKGNLEEFAPKHIERAGLNYAYKVFSTTFIFSYTSRSYADANNTVYSPDATVGLIPSYWVMDWSSTIRIKRYNIKAGITNLTGAKYFNLRTDEYPGPGIIPAQPRSFYVGFGAKF